MSRREEATKIAHVNDDEIDLSYHKVYKKSSLALLPPSPVAARFLSPNSSTRRKMDLNQEPERDEMVLPVLEDILTEGEMQLLRKSTSHLRLSKVVAMLPEVEYDVPALIELCKTFVEPKLMCKHSQQIFMSNCAVMKRKITNSRHTDRPEFRTFHMTKMFKAHNFKNVVDFYYGHKNDHTKFMEIKKPTECDPRQQEVLSQITADLEKKQFELNRLAKEEKRIANERRLKRKQEKETAQGKPPVTKETTLAPRPKRTCKATRKVFGVAAVEVKEETPDADNGILKSSTPIVGKDTPKTHDEQLLVSGTDGSEKKPVLPEQEMSGNESESPKKCCKPVRIMPKNFSTIVVKQETSDPDYEKFSASTTGYIDQKIELPTPTSEMNGKQTSVLSLPRTRCKSIRYQVGKSTIVIKQELPDTYNESLPLDGCEDEDKSKKLPARGTKGKFVKHEVPVWPELKTRRKPFQERPRVRGRFVSREEEMALLTATTEDKKQYIETEAAASTSTVNGNMNNIGKAVSDLNENKRKAVGLTGYETPAKRLRAAASRINHVTPVVQRVPAKE